MSSGDPGTGTTNPALSEGGVISHHQGVHGGFDLVPEVHGWDTSAPVAKVVVEARGLTREPYEGRALRQARARPSYMWPSTFGEARS